MELNQKQLELARDAVTPPTGSAEEPIRALSMDCTALGRILKQLGAGEAADQMAEEVANQLPQLINGATVRALGSATVATAAAPGTPEAPRGGQTAAPPLQSVSEAPIEVLRAQLQEAGIPISPEAGDAEVRKAAISLYKWSARSDRTGFNPF